MLNAENFSFALPMTAPPNAPLPKAAGKANILIIGSDEDTRFLLKTLLEIWNYEVSEAEDFEEYLKNASMSLPRVVLMDVGRFFENTLEMLRKARLTDGFRSLPFILVSGYSQPKFNNAAFESGANEILVKPMDLDLLKNSIQSFARTGEEVN